MNEKNLIDQVLRIINSNYNSIYVIDILSDVVYSFDFDDSNHLVIKERISYTDFIEVAKKFVYPEDLNNYFAALSLNNLEIESQRGNQETKVKYRRLGVSGDYRYHVNIINYLPFEDKKLIFMMSEDINNRLTDTEEKVATLTKTAQEYKDRLNDESESIGNAIYEINSILEMQKQDSTINARDYINSVFNRVSTNNPELNRAIVSSMVNSANYQKPSILIVDDSSIIRNSLKRIFENEYNIVMAKSGNEAIDIITKNVVSRGMNENYFNIAGILLDLVMPNGDGFMVLDFLRNFNLLKKIPVAIISGDETKETRRKVYEYDIVDMLEKPFNTDNIRRRISKIISMYMSSSNLQNIISQQNKQINISGDVKDLENLKTIINKMVDNCLNTPEAKKYMKMARIIALELANKFPSYGLTSDNIDYIVTGVPLYNIGSMAIPKDEIISVKNIRLSIDFGLSIINSYFDNPEEIRVVSNIIKNSCEMFNGSGLPNNLSGNDIPIEAQIANIVIRLNQKAFSTSFKTITDTEAFKYNPDLIEVIKNTKKDLK